MAKRTQEEFSETDTMTDAMGATARGEKSALKAAEAEAARIKEMLRNASGDDAVRLTEQLQAAENEAAAANKAMGEKIMQFVAAGTLGPVETMQVRTHGGDGVHGGDASRSGVYVFAPLPFSAVKQVLAPLRFS